MTHHGHADPVIELSYYVPDPDKPGYLKFAGTPTYREVFAKLDATLEAEGLVDEYFSPGIHSDGPDAGLTPLPHPSDVRFVACYAVTGGSEGHYVHVELMLRDGKREQVALGKTFKGWDHAWTIAKRCAELLGA